MQTVRQEGRSLAANVQPRPCWRSRDVKLCTVRVQRSVARGRDPLSTPPIQRAATAALLCLKEGGGERTFCSWAYSTFIIRPRYRPGIIGIAYQRHGASSTPGARAT